MICSITISIIIIIQISFFSSNLTQHSCNDANVGIPTIRQLTGVSPRNAATQKVLQGDNSRRMKSTNHGTYDLW
jgi:hypothetical protein